ncbi:hypothetical protein GGQ80_000868 [Sphingomonas jinjuensis]|uniref:Uncharacterized protein n=1 Tax=Sphingomonas jinjuensis TaxID=535907 RepID=A0A840F505_9SPHN|nr:hypothetical protein [Sphingomonas jinjuensis]MBB4152980.1 hypothetical protein [Sphingomonas jinjuensis]
MLSNVGLRLLSVLAMLLPTNGAVAQSAAAPPATSARQLDLLCKKDVTGGVVALSGTTVIVSLDDDLSMQGTKIGTPFTASVVEDVKCDDVVAIPQGAKAHGEVTFSSDGGAFGRPGILGISLRTLDVSGYPVELRGTYRETGKEPEAAVAVTTAMVGIFSGFIKGRSSVIPHGRILRARLGEDLTVRPAASPSTAATMDR